MVRRDKLIGIYVLNVKQEITKSSRLQPHFAGIVFFVISNKRIRSVKRKVIDVFIELSASS